jgi:hypothetical protein
MVNDNRVGYRLWNKHEMVAFWPRAEGGIEDKLRPAYRRNARHVVIDLRSSSHAFDLRVEGDLRAGVITPITVERPNRRGTQPHVSYSGDDRENARKRDISQPGSFFHGCDVLTLTRHKLSHGSGERKWQLLEAH